MNQMFSPIFVSKGGKDALIALAHSHLIELIFCWLVLMK